MHNRQTHGQTTKKKLSKCKDIFKAYNDIQFRYGEQLDKCNDIKEIRCNVPIDCELEGSYTTDFYCVKTDGTVFVRECVFKDKLLKPLTVKVLDASRNYWLKQGIKDWGIVLNENK